MDDCPRRVLLGGIGSTIALSVAGCLSQPADSRPDDPSPSEAASNGPADEDENETNDDTADEAELDQLELLEYVPASLEGDSILLMVTDRSAMAEADGFYGATPGTMAGDLEVDESSVSTALVVESQDDFSNPISVLTGDIELEGDTDDRESTDGVEYEYYEANDHVVGVTEAVAIVAESETLLEEALEAGADAEARLADAEPAFEEALELFPETDQQYVAFVGPDDTPEDDVIDPGEIRFITYGTTVVDPDTIEIDYGIEFLDAEYVTDEVVETLETEFYYPTPNSEEPTASVDDTLVTISFVHDLEAEREAQEKRQEIESPRFHSPREIDFDADYVELEVIRGDPTPVEDLALELNDEEYDPDIWANGRETIEEGDTLLIEMDELEPNLSLMLRHDHEYGGSASGTSILSHFSFETDYDLEAETLSIEYADDYPLDGDDLSLAVFEERYGFGDEPLESTQPWAGDELTEGESEAVTVDGVAPGHSVIVGWNGDQRGDSIFNYQISAPGFASTDYDYETKALEVSLELEEPRDASEYRLLLEDDPADTQWADEYETVDDGATITLEDVDVGTDGTIVWGDDDVRITGITVRPTVDLELSDDDGYELEHVGGDSLPVDELEVQTWTDDGSEEFSLTDELEATFDEGDVLELEFDDVRNVSLQYDGYPVGHA